MAGKLYIVGVGPGAPGLRTLRAIEVIRESDVVVAYTTYANLIRDLVDGKELITARMREEVFRASIAIRRALENHVVSLVSGGDPQIYGMASLALELMSRGNIELDFEVVPGVTAGLAVASRLGAPLSMDFAVISLSDLLIPASEILFRVRKAAEGDFVIVFYNPINKDLLRDAMRIVSEYRKPSTPVGIVKNAYRANEVVVVTTLSGWRDHEDMVDMSTTIIVGNSRSYIWRNWIITPRGYRL